MAGNPGGSVTEVATGIAASSTPIQGLVLEAIESRTPLRISGRSHWMDAGRPVAAERIASLAAHDGIVDYVPGDLTITVKAGTSLNEIDRVTGAEGQWLPLNPFGNREGTIGATIATGSFGPLAHGFGRARDLVLGVEFITGEGKIVRGGGRVVKNVAGFDLVRLITGSWGTLGIVTELTMRLYSRPQASMSIAMSVPDNPKALAARIKTIVTAPITPLAFELVNAIAAERIGLPRRAVILIELGGNKASVDAQLDELNRLGGAKVISDPWKMLQSIEGDASSTVFRLSALPVRVSEIWSAVTGAMPDTANAAMHGTPGLGVVRCILPSDADVEAVRRITSAIPDVSVVYERLPRAMWATLSPTVVSDHLSQGIMRAFDPHRILNPGIMGPAS